MARALERWIGKAVKIGWGNPNDTAVVTQKWYGWNVVDAFTVALLVDSDDTGLLVENRSKLTLFIPFACITCIMLASDDKTVRDEMYAQEKAEIDAIKTAEAESNKYGEPHYLDIAMR